MAEEELPPEVETNIAQSIGPTKKSRKRRAPSYRVIGDSKVPVSKATGKVWKSRKAFAEKVVGGIRDSWEEAIRYYDNDQLGHRIPEDHASGNLAGNQRLNNNITETENVIFANVTTMVPALYARNPRAEFTSNTEAGKRSATILERLVNALGKKKAPPGINLKPKAKRCVVTTLLTNRSWIEIGWTFKDNSSEQGLADLASLAKQLEKAKTPKKVEEVEGKIQALEETIDILQPAGPFAKYRSPFDVIVDPNAKEIDLSDAKWVMIRDYMPTEFIKARYGKTKDGETKSVFEPTHIMKLGTGTDGSNENDDESNFSIFKDDSQATSFGFTDQESFDKAKVTEVWMIWDKVTRRVLMFNAKDWAWPVWVWDDPLQLDTFFSIYPLSFFESPNGPLTKGEVTYYLDQQDAINEIVDEERRARRWARRNIFYNSNLVTREDAEEVLNGDDGTARGLNIPEGMKIQDVIGSVVPPSLQFQQLFDKQSKYAAIDRISSVGEVMRGGQFKTNTTNKAVEANVGASNMRVDEKGDQIEDWIGQIYWGIAQLCIQFMDKETVQSIVGLGEEDEWNNMSAQELRKEFSVQVVGGTTKKPTSQAKKEEALELGQVLGQFVNAAPGPVLKVMLEVMQEAFDEVTITEEDWDELIAAVEQQAQQEQGGGGGEEQPQPEQLPPGAGQPDVQSASPDQLKEILNQLPPELKQQVAGAIDSGVPPQQALTDALKNAGTPPQQPQQLQ